MKANYVPTLEQNAIITTVCSGKNVSVIAGAGTGKTSTLELVANANRHKTILYVCFNKSIAVSAQQTMPENVVCSTIASIAYKAIVSGSPFYKRLSSIKYDECKSFLSSQWDFPSEKLLREEVVEMMEQTKSFLYGVSLLPTVSGKDKFSVYINNLLSRGGDMQISHDCYLKLYQLSKPRLDYDIIMFDEAQDASSVILDIINRQTCQKVYVGDPRQSIYGWRGAVDALSSLDGSFVQLPLTSSFRFGPAIAEVANSILPEVSTYKLKGCGNKKEVHTKAILCRSNLDIFLTALSAYEKKQKVFVIGGLKSAFSDLYSALNLRCNGDPKKRFSNTIKPYKKWEDLIAMSEHDMELRKIIGLLDALPNLHKCIMKIKEVLVETEQEADIVITTVHKAKGLEWDEVTVLEGFIPPNIEQEEELQLYLEAQQIKNLLYVAVTRAKVKINISAEIQELINNSDLDKDIDNLVFEEEKPFTEDWNHGLFYQA